MYTNKSSNVFTFSKYEKSTYQNIVLHLPRYFDLIAMQPHFEQFREGLCNPRPLILHLDFEIWQGSLAGAVRRQKVHAVPIEIEPAAIEGGVVGVPLSQAEAVCTLATANSTVPKLTFLIVLAVSWDAGNIPGGRVTGAPLLALVSPEDFVLQPVGALVGAATLVGRHTILPTEQKPLVALAHLCTAGLAP